MEHSLADDIMGIWLGSFNVSPSAAEISMIKKTQDKTKYYRVLYTFYHYEETNNMKNNPRGAEGNLSVRSDRFACLLEYWPTLIRLSDSIADSSIVSELVSLAKLIIHIMSHHELFISVHNKVLMRYFLNVS